MEYIHIYGIKRKMHVRPCVNIVQTVRNLHGKYRGLDILLEDPKTGKRSNCKNIITLLTIGGLFHEGGKIKVIISGEYSMKILKKCADKVGDIFSFRDTH
tara:strand:- start:1971 stop:2270 length:300 start_codon:yes stop_codon:yes gene_type:complete